MTAKLIDGNARAKAIRETIKQQVQARIDKSLRVPGLAVILVGNDPASEVYVAHKRIHCEQVGTTSKAFDLPKTNGQHALLELIDNSNNDNTVDDILVQLPLPACLSANEILERMDPKKDVDGCHPFHFCHLAHRIPLLRPCPPAGVIDLLDG